MDKYEWFEFLGCLGSVIFLFVTAGIVVAVANWFAEMLFKIL